MARFKHRDLSPRFLAVDLGKQLLPGSFPHAVPHLLENNFDLSGFDSRFRKDETGASAYPPGTLLKVILYAYAEGVVSSGSIERLCREHVTFIALSGDSAPHLGVPPEIYRFRASGLMTAIGRLPKYASQSGA